MLCHRFKGLCNACRNQKGTTQQKMHHWPRRGLSSTPVTVPVRVCRARAAGTAAADRCYIPLLFLTSVLSPRLSSARLDPCDFFSPLSFSSSLSALMQAANATATSVSDLLSSLTAALKTSAAATNSEGSDGEYQNGDGTAGEGRAEEDRANVEVRRSDRADVGAEELMTVCCRLGSDTDSAVAKVLVRPGALASSAHTRSCMRSRAHS